MLRLHLRLLTHYVAQWERRFLSAMPFSNAQQRDALDTAFRSMARMAIIDDDCATDQAPPRAHIVFIDLRKCFEQLRRVLLWQTGLQHHYPMVALRLSLTTYGFDRRILGPYDLAGRTVRAARGIAAGSAHATSELKLYLLPVILAIQHKALSDERLVTSLSVFVDDISFSVSSPSECLTLDSAVTVFRDLRDALSQVDLPIAADKTEAIASTDGLHGAFASIIVIAKSSASTSVSLGSGANWTCPKV
jgi:hypothetical protein